MGCPDEGHQPAGPRSLSRGSRPLLRDSGKVSGTAGNEPQQRQGLSDLQLLDASVFATSDVGRCTAGRFDVQLGKLCDGSTSAPRPSRQLQISIARDRPARSFSSTGFFLPSTRRSARDALRSGRTLAAPRAGVPTDGAFRHDPEIRPRQNDPGHDGIRARSPDAVSRASPPAEAASSSACRGSGRRSSWTSCSPCFRCGRCCRVRTRSRWRS